MNQILISYESILYNIKGGFDESNTYNKKISNLILPIIMWV